MRKVLRQLLSRTALAAGLFVALASLGLVTAQAQGLFDGFGSSPPSAPKERVAQAGNRAPSPVPAIRETAAERNQRDRINNWSLGLAAGRTEGAPLQFAAELARVLDDGDNMRVIPMVTRGPFDNIYDLLYLRGVDAAIVYGDVLDHFKNKPDFSQSIKRVNYLLNLFPSEVHIFARPEITSLKDLEGKVVNFNTQGTAAAFSGPIIFSQLGIKVKETFVPHSTAMEKMRTGDEVAATFWVSSKPLAPFLKGKFPPGFKFLRWNTPTNWNTTRRPILSRRTIPRSSRKARAFPRFQCQRCSPSRIRQRTRRRRCASRASSITSSSVSSACRRSPATTRSGRT